MKISVFGSKSFISITANGNEGKAKKFETGISLDAAHEQCQKDNNCAAFAFTEERTVIYTSTGCTASCQNTEWVTNPSLITQAGWCCGQAWWKDAVCYRKHGKNSTLL